ncbi:MAG: hypothetical protein ABSB74_06805 [Tepidisphaeraceae bacterium]
MRHNKRHPLIPAITALLFLLIIAVALKVTAQSSTATLPAQSATMSSGGVITVGPTPVTFTPAATQRTTQPVTPPPVVVVPPPVVPSPVVTPPTTQPGALPGMAGQTYGSDAWLATFPKDANGFVDLTSYIPANAIGFSPSGAPYHGANDFNDLASAQNAAIANGSHAIIIYKGDIYSQAIINTNLRGNVGTAARPLMFVSVGPKGFLDRSLPRPLIEAQLGVANGPAHYVIVDGIDFYADQRDPASPTYDKGYAGEVVAFQVLDQNGQWGAPSDHILIEDNRFRFFHTAINIETGPTYAINTVIIRRNVIAYNYGAFAGAYDYHIHDMLCDGNVLVNNGWNVTAAPKSDPMGREHDWYTGVNPKTETNDPQHRYVNTVFATADSEGLEGNSGGLCDTDLFLANPIAGYVAVYQGRFHNVVVDGGGDGKGGNEFDFGGMIGSALTMVEPPPVPPATNGGTRGWGVFLDCVPTGTMDTVTVINKPEVVNGGFALGVHVNDGAKGLPTVATVAALSNCVVNDWYTWSSSYPNPATGAANALNFNGPPSATITYLQCYFPGVTGVLNVIGAIPHYADPTRCTRTYAQSLGYSGAPALLSAMENQWSGNWKANLEPAAVVNWIQAGFQVLAPTSGNP